MAAVAASAWVLCNSPDKAYLGWSSVLFFGYCAGGYLWNVIKPGKLRLDAEGFTVDGAFGRKHRRLWHDIDSFFLLPVARESDMVAYNYLTGRAPRSLLVNLHRAFGAVAWVPGLWPLSNREVVDLLNDYRNRASFADRD